MSEAREMRRHGEQGAALILAIAFLLVVSAISAAVVSTITSGLNDRNSLEQARNREYTADGAIESSIVRLRNNGGGCGATDAPFMLNDPSKVAVHVDCVSTPVAIVTTDPDGTLESFSQNDVTFTTCLSSPVGTVNYVSGPASGKLTVSAKPDKFASSGVVNVNGATQGVFTYTGLKLTSPFQFLGVTAVQSGTGLTGAVTQGCSATSTIINARINFQGTSSPLSTFVQAWSVDG